MGGGHDSGVGDLEIWLPMGYKGAFKAIQVFCHIALAFEALAFMQTDIVKLRAYECVACVLMIGYSLVANDWNMFDCHVMWSIFHLIINACKVFSTMYKKSRIYKRVTPDEADLKAQFFTKFSVYEFVELKERWKWDVKTKGDILCHEGRPVEHLGFIYKGTADVLQNILDSDIDATDMKDDPVTSSRPIGSEVVLNGHLMSTLGNVKSGQFIGEMSYFTEELASATIQATSTVIMVKWDMQECKELAQSSNKFSHVTNAFSKLPSLFCQDLVLKLASTSMHSKKNRHTNKHSISSKHEKLNAVTPVESTEHRATGKQIAWMDDVNEGSEVTRVAPFVEDDESPLADMVEFHRNTKPSTKRMSRLL